MPDDVVIEALAEFLRDALSEEGSIAAAPYAAVDGDHGAARDTLEQFLALCEDVRIVPAGDDRLTALAVLISVRRMVTTMLQQDDKTLRKSLGIARAHKIPWFRIRDRAICKAIDFAEHGLGEFRKRKDVLDLVERALEKVPEIGPLSSENLARIYRANTI